MLVELPECAADNGPFSGAKHLYTVEVGTNADANNLYARGTGVFVSFKLIAVDRRTTVEEHLSEFFTALLGIRFKRPIQQLFCISAVEVALFLFRREPGS